MKNSRLLAVALLVTLVSIPVSAQRYADTVWEQLQDWYDDYSDDGYDIQNYVVGKLYEDEVNTWTFYLEGDRDFTIVGVCDEDCADIDLAIYDDRGRLIDEDVLEDDYPIVHVSPSRDGEYDIEVTMFSCSVEPCYFGFAIFYE